MKLIGNLLLTLCLVTGCLAAATAYLAPADATGLAGLTLSEGAGAIRPDAAAQAAIRADYAAGNITAEELTSRLDEAEAVVPAKDVLDPARLARLNNDGVRFVEVKEFSLSRWPYAWVFGLSAVGLLAGSLLVRHSAKVALAKHEDAPGTTGAPGASPESVIDAVADELRRLSEELPAMGSDQQKLKSILSRLGAIQSDQIPLFIESRPRLVARHGLGRYAEVMDRFAAMERKINRAWSAAADGHLPESTSSLADAVAIAPEVRAKL